MDWSGWATFGLGATVVLTVIMVLAQLLGLSRMGMPLMLGTMVVGDPDRARVIGMVMHLVMGQVFALAYAGAFAALGWASWWLGALLGLGHGLGALTMIMPLLPVVHPRMASERAGTRLTRGLEPPGILGLNYGTPTPVVSLLAHVAFGMILGATLTPR